MPKEIFDILPPEKIENQILEIPLKSFPKKKKRVKNFLFLTFFLLFFLILGLVVFINGFFYSTLFVYLTPKTETKILKTEIEIQTSQTNIDLEKKILPGVLFEIEKEGKKQFITTGKDFIESKAKGVIRVYNSYNPPTPLNLVANTRFLSAEKSKIFRSLKSINLKPAEIEGRKVIPSYIDIEVIAQESGEDYNIGPSKFSIPGLSGTAFYYTTWAESFTEIKGGFKKEIKVVSEEDIEKSKKILEKELGNLAQKSLKEQLPLNFDLAKKGIFVKVLRMSCDKKTKEQGTEFYCQAKIKATGLGFNLSDLKKIALDFLKINLDFSKEFDPQKLVLDYFSQGLNLDKGKMILTLEIKVPLYEKISRESLISEIKGKSEKEIKRLLMKYPQIKEIQLKFRPFWFKKAPDSLERIRIKIQ